MKILAHLIEAMLYVVYAILFHVLLYLLPSGINVWWSVPIAIGFALFMIVTMGTLFARFPEPLQKYFRNKTPDNPDGCG